MDCCNFMQYRQQSSYYGSSYYDPLVGSAAAAAYHSDLYHQHFYQEYYHTSPYYQHQWHCSPPRPFTDYVYNPKEARIRKAMREASRDRSLGGSPMLPRPSARRPSHWLSPHEEQLMLSPVGGMRSGMESPLCSFPMAPGGASSPYITPINAYGKMDGHMPPRTSSAAESDYVQADPLAQLQQQTKMWHTYSNPGHPSPSGDSFLVRETSSYHPPPHQQPPVGESMRAHIDMEKQSISRAEMELPNTHQHHSPPPPPPSATPKPMDRMVLQPELITDDGIVSAASPSTPAVTVPSIVPPPQDTEHSHQQGYPQDNASIHPIQQPALSQNEHFPPIYNDTSIKTNTYDRLDRLRKSPVSTQICTPRGSNGAHCGSPGSCNTTNSINGCNVITNNNRPNGKALPDFNEAFGSTERGRFQSPPDPRLKTYSVDQSNSFRTLQEEIYLPLSSHTLTVPQEFLSGDKDYHIHYIIKHFEKLPDHELFNVTSLDSQNFLYVTATGVQEAFPMPPTTYHPTTFENSPSFVPTDVGYIPLFDRSSVDDVVMNLAVNSNNTQQNI